MGESIIEYNIDFYDKKKAPSVGTVLVVDRIVNSYDYNVDAPVVIAVLRVLDDEMNGDDNEESHPLISYSQNMDSY